MRRFLALPSWMLHFPGVAALSFAAMALAWPTITLFLLVVFFVGHVLAFGALPLLARH